MCWPRASACAPCHLYLGWQCGARPSEATVRAAASLEPTAFALVQDDVHGRIRYAARPPERPPPRSNAGTASAASPGSSTRFGESAAVLLGDLCLVWAGADAARERRGRDRA